MNAEARYAYGTLRIRAWLLRAELATLHRSAAATDDTALLLALETAREALNSVYERANSALLADEEALDEEALP